MFYGSAKNEPIIFTSAVNKPGPRPSPRIQSPHYRHHIRKGPPHNCQAQEVVPRNWLDESRDKAREASFLSDLSQEA